MIQTDLSEYSQFPRVNFGATIVTNDKYYSDKEEDNASLYMEHKSDLNNTKNKRVKLDAPPTALLDTENTGERNIVFNIDEEIRYTNDGHNEKYHIMTCTFSNGGTKYNFHLESGKEIVTHVTHMEYLYDLDIASIPTNSRVLQSNNNNNIHLYY